MEQAPSSFRAAPIPVTPDQYGVVLAELRQTMCDDKGLLKTIATGQIELLSRVQNVEQRVTAFVDPVTKRARMLLIFGGAGLGGFVAGLLVELGLRLVSVGHALAAVGPY